MTQQEIAKAVLASLHQTGFKSPVWFRMDDGSAFQGIITGLNYHGNAASVQVLDVATDQSRSVAMSDMSEIMASNGLIKRPSTR
ncbi:MAG TPA: hypothetical protein VG125_33485 [Pirellulales bacterium]|jgi:hypothetical protein|nr:hypothetical protein [Pirellulales bacterium]